MYLQRLYHRAIHCRRPEL